MASPIIDSEPGVERGLDGVNQTSKRTQSHQTQLRPGPHATILRLAGVISSFPAMLAICLAVGIFGIAKYRIADPDIWWHLLNATYTVQHFTLPNVDTYSFTTAGLPWIDHEWLSELTYYAAFAAAGWKGIYFVYSSLLAAMIVIVFFLCRGEGADPLIAAMASAVGALLAVVGFGPRTQDFGWLCFLSIYAILLRFRATKRAPLWLVPLLFTIWINCHASWPVGFAVFAIFVCFERLQRKKLIVIGMASIAALFANPYGYRLVLYPFEYATRLPLNMANTEEWLPINFSDTRGKLVIVLLGAVFLLALKSKKNWRMDETILTVFVLYCGLTHVRFLLLVGIALPPILASKLPAISSYDPMRERGWLNFGLAASVVILALFSVPTTQMLAKQLTDTFPERAVKFLRDHPQQGNVFNNYNWGGYLEWNLPETRIFADTRADIFEAHGVLKDYLRVTNLDDSEGLLERYHVSYVLYAAHSPLTYFLSRSSNWKCIYRDDQAVIYRRIEHNARGIGL